jgi:inosine-uridine nucleoside N-ribohydrolase
METSDPDDVFALALLATHPRSNLAAVTIHPGGKDQVGLVKHVLRLLGKEQVPVGVGVPKKDKPRVSLFHYEWLGEVPGKDPDGTATEVIGRAVSDYGGDLHLVTGAALTNIAEAGHNLPNLCPEWTCQGGFAGDNIVPPELRIPKFVGRLTCPTFNLGGDWRAAEYLMCSLFPPIRFRKLVPKNVCHGVFYDEETDSKIPRGAHPGLDLIKDGMQHYFKKHPGGKALHDVIAAGVAIEPTLGTWVSVKPYRTKENEWGCHELTGLEPLETMDAPEPPMIMIKLDILGFNKVLVN